MANNVFLALILALVAFAALVAGRAARKETTAEISFPPEGQVLNVDGTHVHAVVMGAGPDLVLIHGASGNTRDMTFSLAPRLAQDYRVIVFDRPGLGYTDRISATGATLRQQADLLVRASKMLGADAPIVLGHSYGGGVALAWAVYYPNSLSALVPVAGVSNPWTLPLDPFYRVTSSRLGSALAIPLLTAFAPENRVERAIEDIFAPQSVPEGYGDHVGAGLTLRRTSMRANAAQRANLLAEISDLVPRYADITVPTEIVHGTADVTVELSIHAEILATQIPDAVLARLDGIGHMPHHAAQDDVIAAIDRAARRAGLR